MKVWIKNIAGAHFGVDIEPNDTLKILKQRIQVEGVGVNSNFHLYYDSQLISNQDTPSSLNIEEFDIITIVGESKLLFPINLRQQQEPKSSKETQKERQSFSNVQKIEQKQQKLKLESSKEPRIQLSKYTKAYIQKLSSLDFSPEILRTGLQQGKGSTDLADLLSRTKELQQRKQQLQQRKQLIIDQINKILIETGKVEILQILKRRPQWKEQFMQSLKYNPINYEFIKSHMKEFDQLIGRIHFDPTESSTKKVQSPPQITNDQAAIRQIMEVSGKDYNTVTRAYKATNKNKEIAINYLMDTILNQSVLSQDSNESV